MFRTKLLARGNSWKGERGRSVRSQTMELFSICAAKSGITVRNSKVSIAKPKFRLKHGPWLRHWKYTTTRLMGPAFLWIYCVN